MAQHVVRVQDASNCWRPGFADRIVGRHMQTPADLEAVDANIVQGAINGGTAGLHQQLFFRPIPGTGRPETPIPGLFLASASAHPGGGVHGACGWNAALSALGANSRVGAVRRQLNRTAWARLLPPRQVLSADPAGLVRVLWRRLILRLPDGRPNGPFWEVPVHRAPAGPSAPAPRKDGQAPAGPEDSPGMACSSCNR